MKIFQTCFNKCGLLLGQYVCHVWIWACMCWESRSDLWYWDQKLLTSFCRSSGFYPYLTKTSVHMQEKDCCLMPGFWILPKNHTCGRSLIQKVIDLLVECEYMSIVILIGAGGFLNFFPTIIFWLQTCFNFHRCKIFHYYSTLLLHCSILLLFSIFCIWRKFIVGPFDSFIEKHWLYMRLTIWCSLAPVYLFFSLLMSAFGGKWKYLPFLLASQDFICALLQLCIIYNVWPPSASENYYFSTILIVKWLLFFSLL